MSTLDTDWIDAYVRHLRYERRMSPNTEKNYRRDINLLRRFLHSEELGGWDKVDSYHIRAFASWCQRRGLAPRSIQRRMSALRGFFGYLVREGLVESNPAPMYRHRNCRAACPRPWTSTRSPGCSSWTAITR